MREETERWWRHALEDMKTARVTFAGERWSATAFFAQQATEKGLKALWVERTGEPPARTHDLVRLAETTGCPVGRDTLDQLSRAYLLSRYPDAGSGAESDVDEPAVSRLMTAAEEVLAWVERQLSMMSSRD